MQAAGHALVLEAIQALEERNWVGFGLGSWLVVGDTLRRPSWLLVVLRCRGRRRVGLRLEA